jgi:hypothetical protein
MPLKCKASAFFSADFAYPNAFDPVAGLRPYLQIEMTFEVPALPAVVRPIRSLVALAQKQEPEILAFPCSRMRRYRLLWRCKPRRGWQTYTNQS